LNHAMAYFEFSPPSFLRIWTMRKNVSGAPSSVSGRVANIASPLRPANRSTKRNGINRDIVVTNAAKTLTA
jgi:hypothetical protein